jgi:hypothetical protein
MRGGMKPAQQRQAVNLLTPTINIIKDIFDTSISSKFILFLTGIYGKTFVNDMLIDARKARDIGGQVRPVKLERMMRALGVLLPIAQMATVGTAAVLAAPAGIAGGILGGVVGLGSGALGPEVASVIRRRNDPTVKTLLSQGGIDPGMVLTSEFAKELIYKFNVANGPEIKAAGGAEEASGAVAEGDPLMDAANTTTYATLCRIYEAYIQSAENRAIGSGSGAPDPPHNLQVPHEPTSPPPVRLVRSPRRLQTEATTLTNTD